MARTVNEADEHHLIAPEPAVEPETFDPYSKEAFQDAQYIAVAAATNQGTTITLARGIKVCIDRRKSTNDFLSLWVDGVEIAGETKWGPDLQDAFDWGVEELIRGIWDNRLKVGVNEEVAR